ncbi:hypothetical protein HUU61_18295 [Rhodopseudomonas palustris]|nr:hypothetical protein [Rhodopseudomonas palustris]
MSQGIANSATFAARALHLSAADDKFATSLDFAPEQASAAPNGRNFAAATELSRADEINKPTTGFRENHYFQATLRSAGGDHRIFQCVVIPPARLGTISLD